MNALVIRKKGQPKNIELKNEQPRRVFDSGRRGYKNVWGNLGNKSGELRTFFIGIMRRHSDSGFIVGSMESKQPHNDDWITSTTKQKIFVWPYVC